MSKNPVDNTIDEFKKQLDEKYLMEGIEEAMRGIALTLRTYHKALEDQGFTEPLLHDLTMQSGGILFGTLIQTAMFSTLPSEGENDEDE